MGFSLKYYISDKMSILKEKGYSRYYTRSLRKAVVPKKKLVTRTAAPTKHKIVEERPKKSLPPMEQPKPGPDGCIELDECHSKALEDELRKIMIKVWQALPDDAPTDDEKMALEKFRNVASDDIRNALGLNVTQRLLNTFNPLNVKVYFSTKPERKYLRHFLKKYNFVAFKRIVSRTNTFAAQVKAIADYDQLCSNKNIHCGAAKLTISPCYRFLQCPKNLKTIYGIPEEDHVKNKSSDPETKKMEGDESTSKEIKAEKEESFTNAATDKADEPNKKMVDESTEKQSNVKPETNTNKLTEKTKTKPKLEDKSAVQTKSEVTKTSLQTKPEITKANVQTKSENNKASVQAKPASTQNNTLTKPVSANINVPKAAVTAKTATAKPVGNKPLTASVTKTANNQTRTATTPNKVEAAKDEVNSSNKKQTQITTASNKVETAKVTTGDNKSTTNSQAATKLEGKDDKPKALNTNPANIKTAVTPQKPTDTNKTVQSKTTAIKNVETKAINVSSDKTTKQIVTAKAEIKTDKKTAIAKTDKVATAKPAPEIAKNATAVKTNAAKDAQTKTVTNSTPAKKVVKNATATNRTPAKQVVKKSETTKKQTDSKKAAKEDDFDELDDQELYQYLMSAGIVLDECSGSDVE